MYQGWHTTNAVNTVTMICGFLIIFSGVYLLNSIAKKSQPTTTGTNAALSVASVVPGTLSTSFTVSRTSMMEIVSTTVGDDEEKKMTGTNIHRLQQLQQQQNQLRHHHHRQDFHQHHRQKQQYFIRQRQRANSLP